MTISATDSPLVPPEPSVLLNEIADRQNSWEMMELLRAKSALYDASQLCYRIQFWLMVVASVALGALKIVAPRSTTYVDLASIALLVLEVLMLDPLQSKWRIDAASMQEAFDCEVLRLPARPDFAPHPEGEKIKKWASRHPSIHGLRDWYSPVLSSLPLAFARVACQRSGLYWTADMREHYAFRLYIACAMILLALLVAGVVKNATVAEAISWCLTAAPLFVWLAREATRQRETAAANRSLVANADKLWARMLKNDLSAEDSLQAARELQNEIFNQRKSSPQMFPWVYRTTREGNEEAMHSGAERLLLGYRATAASKGGS